MLKDGQKVRGKDGRMMEVITALMTDPICYLVRFDDSGDERIITINHPDALAKPPRPEEKKPAVPVNPFDIPLDKSLPNLNLVFDHLANNVAQKIWSILPIEKLVVAGVFYKISGQTIDEDGIKAIVGEFITEVGMTIDQDVVDRIVVQVLERLKK